MPARPRSLAAAGREGGSGPAAGYGELAPPPALAGRVRCLWWVRPDGSAPSPGGADPARVILPDGCVDLVWHADRLAVAGPDTAARIAAPGTGTTVGVRLRPGAAATFGVPASALRDEHPAAEELWGAAGRRLAERVADQGHAGGRLGVLTAAVGAMLDEAPATDPVVDGVARALHAGRSGVAGLAREAALGERQLRRRFHEHVGYGPKTLERVLRLQRFLGLAISTDEGLAALAALAGYADQAHLGREARALAGATPAELVAARRPGPAASRRPEDAVAARRPGPAASRRPEDAMAARRPGDPDASETSKTDAPARARMAA